MNRFVLDTSVIIKWFNQEDEQNVDKAQEIFRDLTSLKAIITVPTLLIIELHNALFKGKNLPTNEVKKSLNQLFYLPIVIKEPTTVVTQASVDIARKYNLTAYDSIFVAVAVKQECKLISDDKKHHGKITDGTVIMLKDYSP